MFSHSRAVSRCEWPRVAGLACAIVITTGCVSVPVLSWLGPHVGKGRPFIIARSSCSYGWGFFSHPNANKFGDGLLVAYNLGGDVDGATPRVEIMDAGPAWSADGGASWVFGADAIGAEVADLRPLFWGFVDLGGGRRLAVERVTLKPESPQINVAWYENGELTAGPTNALLTGLPDMGPMYVSDRGVRLPSARLIMVGYYADGTGRLATAAIASDDEGKTWQMLSVVAGGGDAPWGSEGPCEPGLAVLPDGSLLCIMRTGSGAGTSDPMLSARSVDGGKSWRHQRMNIGGVMPKLLLMSNGVLVLATGRPGNALYFSLDGGRTWPRQVALTPADVQTSGYCDVVEVSPGRLLAVYDMYDTDLRGFWLWEPKEVNGVLGVFVDVRRLW